LEKELEEFKLKQEENVMYLSMQLNTYKSNCESLETEISYLKDKLDNNVSTNESYVEIQRSLNETLAAKAEQDYHVNKLKQDLLKMTKAKDESVEQLDIIKQEINKLKTEAEDNQSLINRLKQESLLTERNYAMKIAVLATTEVHIEQLKKELLLKEETAKEAVERVSLLQIRLSSAETRLDERVKEMTIKMDQMTINEEQLKKSYEEQLQGLKDKHELQIESVQRENAKKSSTARLMLSEKEEQIRLLQAKVHELQTEIASGGPQER
jgi:chromosome segregation ATPase